MFVGYGSTLTAAMDDAMDQAVQTWGVEIGNRVEIFPQDAGGIAVKRISDTEYRYEVTLNLKHQ